MLHTKLYVKHYNKFHIFRKDETFMINALKSIRRERAKLERDRVVTESMQEDAFLGDLICDIVESDGSLTESTTSDDIEALIDKLPESEEEDSQIERILTADDDIGIDEVLDVSSDSSDPFEV